MQRLLAQIFTHSVTESLAQNMLKKMFSELTEKSAAYYMQALQTSTEQTKAVTNYHIKCSNRPYQQVTTKSTSYMTDSIVNLDYYLITDKNMA